MQKWLIIFIAAWLSSCSGTIKEIEPDNDDQKNAQPVKNNQIFEGTFYSSSGIDPDYLYLPVESAQMVRGEISGVKGIDSEISLFKADQSRPYKIIDDALSSSLGEQFGPILAEKPGIYILLRAKQKVNQKQYQDIPYRFKINTFSPTLPVEIEPNDRFSQAQKIEKNSMTGYYSNLRSTSNLKEKDFFYLPLPEKKKYNIKLQLSAVQSIDPILTIFSASGRRLKVIDEGAIGQGETLASYGIQGPSRLYLSIGSKGTTINIDDYYEISVSKAEYESKYELEPNDTISKASALSEKKVFAEISDRYDVDFFRYENKNEWPIQFSAIIVPDGNLNIRINLVKGSDTVVFDDGAREENEAISNRIVGVGEVIYLKAYTLDWESSKPIPYTIEINEDQLIDNVEQEPNDTRQKANRVVADQTIVGYINPNDDIDRFQLKSSKTEKYKVLVEGIENCKLALSIADKRGVVVQRRVSRNTGDGISLTSNIEPRGYISLTCSQLNDNLYASPYNMTSQSKAFWD